MTFCAACWLPGISNWIAVIFATLLMNRSLLIQSIRLFFFLPFMAFNGISTDLLCKAFLHLNFGGTIVERHLLPYQLVDGLVVRLFNYIFKANSTWFFVVVAPSNLIKPPRF